MKALWARHRDSVLHDAPFAQIILALTPALCVVASPQAAPSDASAVRAPPAEAFAQGFLSEEGLRSLKASMSPGGAQAAARYFAHGRGRDADRPPGWTRFDLDKAPTLGFGDLYGEDAKRINAAIPDSPLLLETGRPFRGADLRSVSGRRALECLTQAVYFEAGRDDDRAQAAVAQVVLNRVRHPAYPASVCGVVYQGALRPTGCQFSFTCDGSLQRGVMTSAWARAQGAARRALSGFVMPEVGVSTNYHADYVAPYWAATLVKIAQVGPHIFYRWTGPLGQRAALTKRYAGNETTIAHDVLASWDERVQGGSIMAAAADATSKGRATAAAVASLEAAGLVAKVQNGRVRALLNPVARQPSVEEVKAINDSLAQYEDSLEPSQY